jgi:hypothetical protein
MAKKFDEVRIPFQKMTFSPDVPATALGPNEYNDGINVETDVRGIRSIAGDQAILDSFPGSFAPTYVTGGYRGDGLFWFVIACVDGSWYASSGTDEGWYDITPTGRTTAPDFYNQSTNITEAWNGTIPFFNDAKTAPMFWPEPLVAGVILPMTQYSQQVPLQINDIIPITPGELRVEFQITLPSGTVPFDPGSSVVLSGVNPRFYNGVWEVISSDEDGVDIVCSVTDAYESGGQVAPKYCWNYTAATDTTPGWKSYYAGFMRIYNTPNVGSILVAGNLTVTDTDDVVTNYPVTVQWSQNFGLNDAPLTWEPTVTNVANSLEVPLRGPAVDAFPCNGQFFVSSYWDTVVFSPINYATTSTPILGVRLFNQGRGMLTSNAWANTDKLVYGVDARDIWVFDGQDFQGLGNQRVKNWFFNQLDPKYVQRMFMEVNTQKNQVEIYYANKDVAQSGPLEGVPNAMISYRYDLDCWNAPREVDAATFACESPIWLDSTDSSLPYWMANEGSRCVVYARGVAGGQLVQKDQGFAWYDDQAIESVFRRDNIKLLPDYSGKLLVHRILPEVVNMGAYPDSVFDELPLYPSTGNITVTIEGANSVGSEPTQITPVTIPIDANGNTVSRSPWAQINQNAFRVNTIELSNTSNTNIWMCSATTWQYTQTEDDH